MSDILTVIRLPGTKFGGLMEYGTKTVAEMIQRVKEHAAYERDQAIMDAENVLNAPDSAFQVEVVRGVHVQHPVRTLQIAEKQKDSHTKI